MWTTFMFIVLLWELHAVSDTVSALSPFVYTHPISNVSLISLVMITAVAAAFTVIGLSGFRRREIG